MAEGDEGEKSEMDMNVCNLCSLRLFKLSCRKKKEMNHLLWTKYIKPKRKKHVKR